MPVRTFLAFAALIPVVAPAGARSKDGATRFRYQDEAGSGHVAVLSVTPWDAFVRAQLQPTFEMTPQKALAEVVPTTRLLEEKLLDVLHVALGVGTPRSATTKTRTVKTGPDEEGVTRSTETGERTETLEPGESPATAAAPELRAADLPGRPKILEGDVGIDPVVRHNLAAAYYQEVQLLNRYVRDAVQRVGYTAYVVRIQASLMPRARNAPYDAYTTISFFPPSAGAGGPAPVEPQFLARLAQARSSGDEQERRAVLCLVDALGKCIDAPGRTPIVVPLLVTDSLEAQLSSRSSDVVRQYALALSALLGGFAASADAQKFVEQLRTTVGNDYNSLYSVSRLTENTLRVRFGAMLQNVTSFAMVPQTRSATVLLLVPDEAKKQPVQVVSRTEFVDALSGKDLLPRSGRRLRQRYRDTFRSSLSLEGIREWEEQRELVRLVASNDYQGFSERYVQLVTRTAEPPRSAGSPRSAGPPRSAPAGSESAARASVPQAWTTLTSAFVGSQWTSTEFTLPDAPGPTLPECGEAVTVLDDGKNRATATLSGVRGLAEEAVGADLLVGGLRVPASTVKIDPARGTLSLAFPSLKRLTVERAGEKKTLADQAGPGAVRVALRTTASGATLCTEEYPATWLVLSEEPAKPDPRLKLRTLPALQSTDRAASLDLILDELKDVAPGSVVAVKLAFLREDGKPAPGVLTKVVGAPGVSVELNEVKVPIARDTRKVALKLDLGQLEDRSTLRVTAGFKDQPPATADVLIAVPKKEGKGDDGAKGGGK